jgi:hypothetical protein
MCKRKYKNLLPPEAGMQTETWQHTMPPLQVKDTTTQQWHSNSEATVPR